MSLHPSSKMSDYGIKSALHNHQMSPASLQVFLLDLLGFSCTTVSRFYWNGAKTKKHPVSSSSTDGKILLMKDVRRECSELTERPMVNPR